VTARSRSVTGSVRGFTLIELLVVLAILVMAAALFPLALNRALPGRRVAASVDHLVATLHDAEAESAVTGLPVTLRLPDARSEEPLSNSRAIVHAIAFRSLVRVELKDGDGARAPALTVFPDGSAQAGEYAVESGARRSLVRVSGLTGRIAVRRDR
jgi:general secretion pathway protein H